jgi:hypothetical protein
LPVQSTAGARIHLLVRRLPKVSTHRDCGDYNFIFIHTRNGRVKYGVPNLGTNTILGAPIVLRNGGVGSLTYK